MQCIPCGCQQFLGGRRVGLARHRSPDLKDTALADRTGLRESGFQNLLVDQSMSVRRPDQSYDSRLAGFPQGFRTRESDGKQLLDVRLEFTATNGIERKVSTRTIV